MSEPLNQKLITFSEFARRINVTPQAVSSAASKGRLSIVVTESGRRMLDPAIAFSEWHDNADESKRAGPASRDGKLAGLRYQDVKVEHEFYKAKIQELEFKKKAGELVDASEVRKRAFNLGRVLRDSLITIPDRISAELAATSDVHEIRTILINELIKATKVIDGAEPVNS